MRAWIFPTSQMRTFTMKSWLNVSENFDQVNIALQIVLIELQALRVLLTNQHEINPFSHYETFNSPNAKAANLTITTLSLHLLNSTVKMPFVGLIRLNNSSTSMAFHKNKEHNYPLIIWRNNTSMASLVDKISWANVLGRINQGNVALLWSN